MIVLSQLANMVAMALLLDTLQHGDSFCRPEVHLQCCGALFVVAVMSVGSMAGSE